MIHYLDMQHVESQCIGMSFDERFQMMIDSLYQEKYNSKIQRLLKTAKLRLPKAEINDIHYIQRGIDKQMMMDLGTCQFMGQNTSVIFQGFTGSGKTYLACALGKQACRMQYRTKYTRISDLLMEYDESTLVANGPQRLLKKYAAFALLILDEWLLEEISDMEQHFLFELIERSHDATSTIFCTQFRKEDWHSRLGGGVHADAIMDWIVHNAVFIEIGTLNMREFTSARRDHSTFK